MNYRSFGSTGLQVSEIGLGCSHLGNGIFFKNDSESIRLLHRAFELGINFYDTAGTYGSGHSEELIGRAFKNRRDEVIIASKVGYRNFLPSSIGRIVKTSLRPIRRLIRPLNNTLKTFSKETQNFSSEYIKNSIEQTLRRLRTDYLDLYQLHTPPTSVIEEGEVFKTLDDLKLQGKIRFYGVSAETISDAVLCLNYSNVSSLQVVFNVLEQEANKELLPLAHQKKIAIIARVPLAKGLLTDKKTVQVGSSTKYNNLLQKGRANAEKLSFLVNESRTLSQAAIQFVLHYPQVSVVIQGTSKAKNLEENIGALKSPSLTKEELEKITLLSQS